MQGLILFDWDNTIVDDNNQINSPDIHLEIQIKIEEGWLIGLNSDTPLKRLRRWWDFLKLNGPIVAERGAVIWWPGEQEIILSREAGTFSALREAFMSKVRQMGRYILFSCDNVEFVKSANRVVNTDSTIVVLDAYRVCSIGMFIRSVVNENLHCQALVAKKVRSILESVCEPYPRIAETIDLYEPQCFLSVNDPDITKSVGVRELLKQWAKPPRVYMIGDSLSDYLGIEEVNQLAVGNAREDYKKKSQRVATQSFAAGCIELMRIL